MGHFHPVLVHLPIGFLMLAVLMDLLAYRQKWINYRAAVPFTLFLGFLAALLSCGTGYVLAQSGSYDYETLNLHQWAAWVTAGFSGLLWGMSILHTRGKRTSRPVFLSGGLFLLGILVAFTGHQGGTLTHGEGYLTWQQSDQTGVGRPVSAKTPVEAVSLNLAINPDLPLTIDQKAIEKLQKYGFNVRYLLKKPIMLDLSLPQRTSIAKAELDTLLTKVAPAVVWLNLADKGLQANDLQVLKICTNLEKLRLEKNPIKDDIVQVLQKLEHLEALNLNETQVSEAAVEQLKRLSIKRIYAWNVQSEK